MSTLRAQIRWGAWIIPAAIAGIAVPVSERATNPPAATPSTADQCSAAIPQEAAGLVHAQFPGYRLPRETDSLREYRQSSLENGGSACLLVAHGDFDGDSSEDIAILLVTVPPRSSDSTLLIAIRHPQSGWQLDRLRVFGAPDAAFVTRLPPGTYQVSEAARRQSDALEPGEVFAFQSTHDSIDAGKLESSDIGFFYSRGRWGHIWLSD